MGPVGHTVISSAVGIGVGAATGSPEAGALALGVGVLMDADHLFDFYQWYIRGRPNRVYILFHGWEYSVAGLIVLAAVFFHPLFLAAVLGHLFHVATDSLHNRMSPYAYFVTYRIAKRFDAAFIAPGHNVMDSYRGWLALIPFGHLLNPWFQRRIEPWFEARVKRVAISAATPRLSDDSN